MNPTYPRPSDSVIPMDDPKLTQQSSAQLRRPMLNSLPSLHLLNSPIPTSQQSVSSSSSTGSSPNNLLTPPTTFEGGANTTTAPEAYSTASNVQSSSFPTNSSMSYWAAASSSAHNAASLGTTDSPRHSSFSGSSSQYSFPSLSSSAPSTYTPPVYFSAASSGRGPAPVPAPAPASSAGMFYGGPSSYGSQPPPLLPLPSAMSQQPAHQSHNHSHSNSYILSPTEFSSTGSFQQPQPQVQPPHSPQPQQYYTDAYQPWSSGLNQQAQQPLVRRPSLTAPRSFEGRYPYPPPLTSHLLPPSHLAHHSQQPIQQQQQQSQQQQPAQERPFKCDQCPQSFNRNHDLKRHKRIHLDIKPFPCLNCDKTFSRKDALKRHTLVKGCGGSDMQSGSTSISASN
ncbi:zinc finger protein [Lipomyces arxii]|uniref:zinc finger protein n=1 Tax=Lipomyces arxii TaxID=56418 RepID=UPI0034CEAF8B